MLRSLGYSYSQPWVVIGDFNEIVSNNEKHEGHLRDERAMHEFCNVLDDCGVMSMGYLGRWYTWKRENLASNNIRESLDKGVATTTWLDLFPNFSLKHLISSCSDHCPVLFETTSISPVVSRKYFRFEQAWLLDDEC